MILLMWESPERGYLRHKSGSQITPEQLARSVGGTVGEIKRCLSEMEDAGTFSRLEDGTIYNRRMIRDEKIRLIRKESGRLGGNPNLVNQTVKQNGKQKPTPSSSSSSSSSEVPPYPRCDEIDSAAQWLADQVCERHHRKGDRGIVERMLVSELAPLADEEQWQWAKTFDDRHKRWCQSDEWTKANRKFVPKLSNWIANGGWRDDPPQSDDDMAFVEKKPSSRGVDPEAPWVAPWET